MTERTVAGGWGGWAEAGLLFMIALGVGLQYARNGGEPLFFDEYYHLLAARSWAENGTFAVGEGVYTRAGWLSATVGFLFRNFEESIFVARLPGVLAFSVWALTLFIWVRITVGRTAAWIGALGFCLSPLVLINTVMIRFYGIAGLLFWMGSAAVLLALDRHRSFGGRVALALMSVVFLELSLRGTPPAKIWVAGLALWLAGVAIVEGVKSPGRLRLLGGGAVLLVLLGMWAFWSGWIAEMWSYYQQVPGWSMDRAGDLRWYEHLVRRDYPAFWTFLPVAAILAVVRKPLAGTLAAAVFGVGIALLSLGGTKAERFFFPLMPFFFILWSISISELIPGLRSRISSLFGLLPFGFGSTGSVRYAGHLLLALVTLFALLMTPGVSRMRHVLGGDAVSLDRPIKGYGASPSAWEEVGRVLGPVMKEVDVVVTANSLQTLYHLGSYDFEVHPTVIPEITPPEDFGRDPRTGKPVISTLESLILIIHRHPSGLVYGERWRWGHPSGGFTQDVADYITANLEPVPLPWELGVIAYRW